MIHIAIVSHGHEELLISGQFSGLPTASEKLRIWLKDNKPSNRLKEYCLLNQIVYTDTQPGLGFGENNNILFQLIQENHGFQPGDHFIVMNPDITIDTETLFNLCAEMAKNQIKLATINLFRDQQEQVFDSNIRHFPQLLSGLRILANQSLTKTYDKAQIHTACDIEWASGAFLAFEPKHYAALHGFNQHYFMYFEDVDICYRSYKLLQTAVHYYPQFKARHLAARQNRNLISPHAAWFIRSFFVFMWRRYLIYHGQIRTNQTLA